MVLSIVFQSFGDSGRVKCVAVWNCELVNSTKIGGGGCNYCCENLQPNPIATI